MKRFQQLFKNKKHVFIPYFMLGYPTVEKSLAYIKMAIDQGADALELGMPFSDPIADGPTIQQASQVALKNGMDFKKALQLIKQIRDYSDIPLGFMTYYNIIFKQGDKALTQLVEHGIDALLCVDVLPDDLPNDLAVSQHFLQSGLDTIYLIAPNTPLDRAKMICQKATAFAYMISVYGTTGARDDISPDTLKRLAELKSLTDTPIVVGFGISNPQHMQQLFDSGANGAIIASHIINMIQQNPDNNEPVLNFLKQCHVSKGE